MKKNSTIISYIYVHIVYIYSLTSRFLKDKLKGKKSSKHKTSTINARRQCVRTFSCFSCVQLFATLWTVVHQAPLSMGFYWKEYWSGLPFPPPGEFLQPREWTTSPMSPALWVDSLPLRHQGSPQRKINSLWAGKNMWHKNSIFKKVVICETRKGGR